MQQLIIVAKLGTWHCYRIMCTLSWFHPKLPSWTFLVFQESGNCNKDPLLRRQKKQFCSGLRTHSLTITRRKFCTAVPTTNSYISIFMQFLAQAFAANCICKIPCVRTMQMGSNFSAVHKLSSREKSPQSEPGLDPRARWESRANATSVLCGYIIRKKANVLTVACRSWP